MTTENAGQPEYVLGKLVLAIHVSIKIVARRRGCLIRVRLPKGFQGSRVSPLRNSNRPTGGRPVRDPSRMCIGTIGVWSYYGRVERGNSGVRFSAKPFVSRLGRTIWSR